MHLRLSLALVCTSLWLGACGESGTQGTSLGATSATGSNSSSGSGSTNTGGIGTGTTGVGSVNTGSTGSTGASVTGIGGASSTGTPTLTAGIANSVSGTTTGVGTTGTVVTTLDVSPGRGIYTTPVDVVVSDPSATSVLYTLDGSDPRGTGALTGTLPLNLHIDPADTTNRYTAPGVVLRLTTAGPTATNAQVVTHTYLFNQRIVDLSPDGVSPGGAWPEQGGVRGTFDPQDQQAMDYGIDPDIAQDAEYGPELLTAINALPSVSIVTDLPNLFDPTTGIYVNAKGRGQEWERFGSFEILDPVAGAHVQVNAGLRIRGGSSREGYNPKHAFRLFFRSEYGAAKLVFPLFGSEGVTVFDKIDLRTSQNYSWSKDSQEAGAEAIMVRDVFSRDLQGLLGRPYTRSRSYHLYLDGVYWGIFESEERPEGEFGESYLGGTNEDYDVVKVASDLEFTLEAANGTLDVWQAVWQLTLQGFASDANYYLLAGLNASGVRDVTLPVLVDIDNLIDYMLLVFYAANFDAPVSKWFDNKNPNNFFALRSTVSDRGFVFVAHDNEHSLFAEPILVCSGVSEDRVNIGVPGGAKNGDGVADPNLVMDVTEFERFHPQWLHQRLTENALYRARFSARAHALLDAGGLLTSAHTLPVFDARVAEIEPAIVAESARWGDAQTPDQAYTKNDHWEPAVERVRTGFLPQRTSVVIGQLQAAGLY